MEQINLLINLGALSFAALLYAAYIKNLRALLTLKTSQLQATEKDLALERDRCRGLERQGPEYVEKILNERIRVREEELQRLKADDQNKREDLENLRDKIGELRAELEITRSYGRAIIASVDGKEKFLPLSDLNLITLGHIYVDSASILICDPWHLERDEKKEREDFPLIQGGLWVRDVVSGETLFFNNLDEVVVVDRGREEDTVRNFLENGRFVGFDAPDELPALPTTYIKGGTLSHGRKGRVKHCSFYNGLQAAGLVLGVGGDGLYAVCAEEYEGGIKRIFIDVG